VKAVSPHQRCRSRKGRRNRYVRAPQSLPERHSSRPEWLSPSGPANEPCRRWWFGRCWWACAVAWLAECQSDVVPLQNPPLQGTQKARPPDSRPDTPARPGSRRSPKPRHGWPGRTPQGRCWASAPAGRASSSRPARAPIFGRAPRRQHRSHPLYGMRARPGRRGSRCSMPNPA